MKQLLTALILTAAALATISASAYLAAFRDGIGNWGFAVDAPDLATAEQQARDECETQAGNSGDCVNRLIGITINRCLAIGISNDGGIRPAVSTTIAIIETTRNANATAVHAIESLNTAREPYNTFGAGFHYTLVDMDSRDVCDSTCTGNTVPPQYEDFVGSCEPVKSNADCQTVAVRDVNNNMYVDTNTNGETICREELACSEGNRIPNGSGGCTICEANQMADGDNDECIPIVPLEVEVPVPVTVTTNMEVTVTTNMEVTVTRVTMVETVSERLITVDGMLVTVTNTVTNNIGNQITNTIIRNTADHAKTAGLAAGIGVGIGAIVLGLHYLINVKTKIILHEPSYSFRNNNGILSYSVGNRWTANSENWRFYWQQNINNDKFVYGSGFGYKNGILSAAMNSQSESNKTALDLDLAANKTFGLWNLGGGYNFDMEISETETDTQNRINAKVRYTMDKWILSATATTDTARINYSYRF